METRPPHNNPLDRFISRRTPFQRWLLALCILMIVAIPLASFVLNHHDSPSPTLIAQQLKLARQAIITMPEKTAQARVKKAALLWATGKVTTELNNGQTDTAASLLGDINRMRKQAIGQRHNAPTNLFPPIPQPATNPFMAHMFDNVAQLFDRNDLASISRAALQTDVLDAAQALCHPQSPLKDDPRMLTLLFNLLDREFDGWTDRSIGLAGFDNSSYTVAYAMLNAIYPDIVPPTISSGWEQAVLLNAQQIVTDSGIVYNNHRSYATWWNSDIRQAEDLLASSWILHNADFASTARNAVATLARNAYKDGAFSYRGLENDSCAYHGDDIHYLAWYWLLSGDASARQLLLGAKHFYPLCYDPRGVAENFTAPADRHDWTQARPGDAAYIIASMTSDGYNAALAGNIQDSELSAIFYRADLVKKTLPDNYLLYDQNIQGPRGHFGTFSFAATTRDASITAHAQPDTNLGIGKATFVGAMLLDPSSSTANWPLNAALDSVTSEVQVDPMGNAMGLDRRNFRSFPQHEYDAVTMSHDFAALSTVYTVTNKTGSRGAFTPLQWRGEQQWLFLPDRIIGLLSITSLADQQAYGLDGTLKLISGRDTWGTRKGFQVLDPSTVRYGDMVVRIHDQNYGGSLQTSLEAPSTAEPIDPSNKGGRILLRDAHATGTRPVHYSIGETYYYEVEIFPTSSRADQTSALMTGSKLTGFQVNDEGRALQVIANPTDAPLTYKVPLVTPYQYLSIHTSSGSIQNISVTSRMTSISMPVAAHGNVVIVNSDKRSDQTNGYATAATVFDS